MVQSNRTSVSAPSRFSISPLHKKQVATVVTTVVVLAAALLYTVWPRPVEVTGCVLGIDGYGSTNSLRAKYVEWVRRVVPGCIAGEGSAVMAFPINGASMRGQQVWLRHEDGAVYIGDESHDAEVTKSAVDRFVYQVESEVINASDPGGNTDIIAGVNVGAAAFKPGQTVKTMLLFTDGINSAATAPFVGSTNLDPVDLSTPESRSAVIDKLDRRGLLPDLTGVEVKIYGANVTGYDLSPDALHAIEAFWRAYFERTGAHLSEYTPAPQPQ